MCNGTVQANGTCCCCCCRPQSTKVYVGALCAIVVAIVVTTASTIMLDAKPIACESSRESYARTPEGINSCLIDCFEDGSTCNDLTGLKTYFFISIGTLVVTLLLFADAWKWKKVSTMLTTTVGSIALSGFVLVSIGALVGAGTTKDGMAVVMVLLAVANCAVFGLGVGVVHMNRIEKMNGPILTATATPVDGNEQQFQHQRQSQQQHQQQEQQQEQAPLKSINV
jgi:hypothetical protein